MTTRDCSKLADLLPLHAVGDTEVDEALAVEEHLQRCADCRPAVEAYARLAENARRELSDVPDMPAHRRVAAALDGLSGQRPRRLGRLALAAATIAAALLVGRWSALETREPRAERPRRDAVAAVREARDMPGPPAAAPLSIFSPAARAFLTDVARAPDGQAPAGDGG